MKAYFLILWLAGQEPYEIDFSSLAFCEAAYARWSEIRLPVSRCHMRLRA